MAARVSAWMLGVALVTVGVPVARAGDGFRCESGLLVNVGDSSYEVQRKCGEPDQVTEQIEKRTVREKVRRWIDGVLQEVTEERQIDVPIHEWTYDMGQHRLIRFLRFENERLVRVVTGRRGVTPG